MIEINTAFEKSICGRNDWLRIKSRHGNSESIAYVLVHDSNKELVECTLSNLNVYSEYRCVSKFVVITDDKEIKDLIDAYALKNVKSEKIDDISNILDYYKLVDFTKNIIVISDREPFGTGILKYLEPEEMVDYVISAVFKVR